MNRNNLAVSQMDESKIKQWALSRETDMPVAVAIHAIATDRRPAYDIWESPTQGEVDAVKMAIDEYTRHGDYENQVSYSWGDVEISLMG